MQNRPYSELFDTTQALCGVVFANIEKGRIKALVNRRARRAYKASNYWTRFLTVGEERSVVNGVIPFTEDNKSPIDTFLRVYPTQPYLVNSTQDCLFTLGPNGAALLNGGIATDFAYVTYKSQFSETYGAGLSSGDPSGLETDNVDIPVEWFEYMAYGAYSDYLRAEGQQEKAAIADQEANELLLDELMKLDEQHTQTIISPRIFTYANMQYRYNGSTAVGYANKLAEVLPEADASLVVDEAGDVIILEDNTTLTTEG